MATLPPLWVLILAVGVRALYAAGAWLVSGGVSVFHGLDSESYIAPARELLANGTFTTDGRPELLRTPGFPLMLLPGLWLGQLEVTTVTLQILLSAVTVWGVYRLAPRRGGDSRVAVTAGALYAVEPVSVIDAAELRPEPLFTAMVVWALVLIVGYVRDTTRPGWRVVVGASILAAAAYVRPAGYYLPFVVVALLASLAAARRAWRELPWLAASAALALAIVVPWTARNRAHGFDGFSAISAINLYFYDAGAVRAAQTGTPVGQMRTDMGYGDEQRYLQLHPEQRAWAQGSRFAYMRAEGRRIIDEHPAVYGRLHLAGMMRVLLDPGATDLLKPYGLYPRAGGLLDRVVTYGGMDGLRYLLATRPLAGAMLVGMALVLLVVYGLSLRGLIAGWRARDAALPVLLVCIAYFVAISGGPAAVARFRHAAMPVICVLTAMGLHAHRMSIMRGRESAPAGEGRRQGTARAGDGSEALSA